MVFNYERSKHVECCLFDGNYDEIDFVKWEGTDLIISITLIMKPFKEKRV